MDLVRKGSHSRSHASSTVKISKGESPALFMVEPVLSKPSDRDSPSKGSSHNQPKKRKRRSEGSVGRSNSYTEAQYAALQRANELQACLSPEFPSFTKFMLPSHVTGGFWLGLAKPFCVSHMPKVDDFITLEDESGKLYQTKYLVEKMGFSGGWRGFSIAHNLLETDALVFHMIQPLRFKVYILRSQSQGPDELDGARGLLELDSSIKPKKKVNSGVVVGAIQENDSGNRSMILGSNSSQSDQLEQNSEDLYPEALRGLTFSDSAIMFEEVTSLGNFSIIVDGLVLDAKFTPDYLANYYDLCRSQGCYLHENVLKSLNSSMLVGMITETVSIAIAIKQSKLTDDFITWDQALKGLEFLGMNVNFLIVRLDELMKLALKLKRYKDARLEHLHAKEKLKTLEAEVMEVKKTIKKLDEEIAVQDMSPESVMTMFEELAGAPW